MARRNASDFETRQRRAKSSSARTDSTSRAYVVLMVVVAIIEYGHTPLVHQVQCSDVLTSRRASPPLGTRVMIALLPKSCWGEKMLTNYLILNIFVRLSR